MGCSLPLHGPYAIERRLHMVGLAAGRLKAAVCALAAREDRDGGEVAHLQPRRLCTWPGFSRDLADI